MAPTGVFVETKADESCADEGKRQLGLWLASWMSRVAEFSAGAAARQPLPFVPVVLVLGNSWTLYFAFERETIVEALGPLMIGDTRTLLGTYRISEVLRLLAGWVAGPFARLVADVVEGGVGARGKHGTNGGSDHGGWVEGGMEEEP